MGLQLYQRVSTFLVRFKGSFIYKQGILYCSPFVFLDKGELVSPESVTFGHLASILVSIILWRARLALP